MGLDTLNDNGIRPNLVESEKLRTERFGRYFPRLFAYAHSLVEDDVTTRAVVIDSFGEAFACPTHLSDEQFALVLFGHARDLCQVGSARHTRDGLNHREREVLALMFDAQLNRPQIGSLLRIKEDAVGSALVKGLRKLSASMSSAAPAFLRAW